MRRSSTIALNQRALNQPCPPAVDLGYRSVEVPDVEIIAPNHSKARGWQLSQVGTL